MHVGLVSYHWDASLPTHFIFDMGVSFRSSVWHWTQCRSSRFWIYNPPLRLNHLSNLHNRYAPPGPASPLHTLDGTWSLSESIQCPWSSRAAWLFSLRMHWSSLLPRFCIYVQTPWKIWQIYIHFTVFLIIQSLTAETQVTQRPRRCYKQEQNEEGLWHSKGSRTLM